MLDEEGANNRKDKGRKSQAVLSPELIPTSIPFSREAKNRTQSVQRPKTGGKQFSHNTYSLQLKETSQQRRLNNYQKHLMEWDQYERNVQVHFEKRDQLKFGEKYQR